jgi:carboxymethylenebutenolidase
MQPPQNIASHKMTCRKLTLSCNRMHARAHSRRISAIAVSICAILDGCTRAETLPRTNVSGGTDDSTPMASSVSGALARGPGESPRRVYEIERSFVPAQQLRLSLHLPLARTAPLTTVLVFHSAMGRTESVLESCDRLAEHGFAAVALDFYDGHVAASLNEATTLRDSANSRVPVVRGIIEEAYRQLESDPRLLSNTRFLLGWSFGAAWATAAAGFLPDVKGVVAYYGEAFSDNSSLDERLTAPVLFIGAERDSDPSPDQLHAIVGRLTAKGKVAQLLLVPAAHGFTERSHPGFDPGATALAWANVIRFLDENAPRDPR